MNTHSEGFLNRRFKCPILVACNISLLFFCIRDLLSQSYFRLLLGKPVVEGFISPVPAARTHVFTSLSHIWS